MATETSHVPTGYRTITPCLLVENASTLIEFIKEVLDAEERMRATSPDGAIQHAEVGVGDMVLMLGERMPDEPAYPAALYVYVPNCDATYQRALALGARSLREPENQHWGDRVCELSDGWGNRWIFATPIAALAR